MARQTHAVWLLLVLTGVESLIFQQTIYRIGKPRSDYYQISSELWRENIAFSLRHKTSTPSRFKVDVILAGPDSVQKQCSFWLETNKNVESVSLNSLKRIRENQLLLGTDEQIKSGNRYTTLIVLDMHSCKIKFPLQLSGKNIVHKRYDYDDKFDIFTDDKVFCKSVGDKCRIRYYESFYAIEPFEVDLDWSSLRIERTFKDDVYLMCGLNGSGKYQVELHSFAKNDNIHKELVSLSYVEGMQIITSDLAVCWILDTKKEHTTVYCSQFDQKGALIFSSTITFQKRVSLIYMYNVRPGKIILLTGSNQSGSWRIFITVAERDNPSKPTDDHQIDLECTGSAAGLAFDARDSDRMVEIEYTCGSDKFIYYNTIYIVDK